MSKQSAILSLAAVAAIAVAAWFWRDLWLPPAPQPVAVAPAAPASAPAPVASAPAHYPVDESAAEPLAAAGIADALAELLGRKSMALLQTADFPRRLVATVDNLGRAHAPPLAWPVTPAPGKFTVREEAGSAVIAEDNGARYLPFVLLAESIDVPRAVKLYQRMYPLLQRSYQEIGFPRGYFNNRLVEVIDLLLATPQPQEALQVQLVEVKGSVPSERPWVRYEFADPALESLAAGQKILLRMGPANERRLKAKLRELRAGLTRAAPAR